MAVTRAGFRESQLPSLQLKILCILGEGNSNASIYIAEAKYCTASSPRNCSRSSKSRWRRLALRPVDVHARRQPALVHMLSRVNLLQA
jgi:hypothetical protein